MIAPSRPKPECLISGKEVIRADINLRDTANSMKSVHFDAGGSGALR